MVGYCSRCNGRRGLAAWQKFIEGVGRADGFRHRHTVWQLSMLLGVLCLAGLGWGCCAALSLYMDGALLTGALCGMLGSLFSGSRGGWVGLPIIGLVLYRSYGHCFSVCVKLSMAGFVTLLLANALYVACRPVCGSEYTRLSVISAVMSREKKGIPRLGFVLKCGKGQRS